MDEQDLVQLNILIRKRGSVKASLTSLKKFIDDIKDKDSLDDITILDLQQKIPRFDELLVQFNEIQNQIELLADDHDVERQYQEREQFVNSLDKYLAISRKILNMSNCGNNLYSFPESNEGSPNGSVRSSPRSTNSRSARELNECEIYENNASVGSSNTLSGLKLPVIELPKFNGKYEVWLEFRDTFDSLIHNNTAITDIQKFHYLRASLQGEAAQVIKSIEMCSQNYENAYKTLKERYDNKRLLVHNHLQSIFSLEASNRESAGEIRQLSDTVFKHLRSLKQLGENTENWDTLIIYIVATKLDRQSSREWEKYVADQQVVTLDNLKTFLKNRADFLETIETKIGSTSNKRHNNFNKNLKSSSSFASVNLKCVMCSKDHVLPNCGEFMKLDVDERINTVKKNRLCMNCLRGGHFSRYCRGNPCKKCKLKHNVSLHINTNSNISNENQMSNNEPNQNTTSNPNIGVSLTSNSFSKHVLLSTVMLEVLDKNKIPFVIRAVLDSGSQSSYITESLCNKLKVKKNEVNYSVLGINNSLSKIKFSCEIKVRSLQNKFESSIFPFVLPQITGNLPSVLLNISDVGVPRNITLADPEFYKPGPIDLLIGCDLFYQLLCIGQIKLGENKPILQKTVFGWVVAGPIIAMDCSFITRSYLANNTRYEAGSISVDTSDSNTDIEVQLKKFWEMEELVEEKPISSEELFCEEHFQRTTRREEDGRFVVSIPFKDSVKKLGISRANAEKRFYSLEKRLESNSKLKEKYISFIEEYEFLGHMNFVEQVNDDVDHFYLPHHGVIREESLTTKLRVVFDASAPTSSGFSLNNLQAIGPTVQHDLVNILLNFRIFKVVVSSDIEKMYRQVLVEPNQRCFQRILWRKDPSESLKVYHLNTVTYGMAASSYLATKCLDQIANDVANDYPRIAEMIRNGFYMDDLVYGGDDVDTVIYLCELVSNILKRYGFVLRKWKSNNKMVVQALQSSTDQEVLSFVETGNKCKTLGVGWCPNKDSLKYSIAEYKCEENERVTKRSLLSHIAQIFDPLGLLGPCTMLAKQLLQQLWQQKFSWDESVPSSMYTKWVKFRFQLSGLNDIDIPRRVICENPTNIEIHGFSDASELGYGGCIYLRSENDSGERFVRLLCAKSKVAPLKTITIPRLELCAALLLAKLFKMVLKSVNVNLSRCIFWSDSTIVLSWLRTSPNRLKIFVANRIVKINGITQDYEWRYVPSAENPADVLSRGSFPMELKENELWWKGPAFLNLDEESWPRMERFLVPPEELRSSAVVNTLLTSVEEASFPFDRFSTLNKLKRTFAYVMRFKINALKPKEDRNMASLSFEEIQEAYFKLIRIAQIEAFPKDYNDLSKNRAINSKSNILSLSPFMDHRKLIRVGGRLTNADYEYDKKHPILLCAKHHLSKLLMQFEHLKMKHCGVQLLLASVREKFWVTSGKRLAKRVVKECLTCFRLNAKIVNPIMGNLPRTRFSCNFPFQITGVDYGGPFEIKESGARNSRMVKCYICLFVCFSTKSLHLELVSDLSTEGFMLALRRFVSRRGLPHRIVSDNGRNFVGAKSELKELSDFLNSRSSELINECLREEINWSFIPAHSPHIGGLWEAGIKSVKYHLKRTLGKARLNFEQFNTIILQIEAILNSRPLCSISSDPNDLSILTPAHFLVGRSLVEVPDPDVTHLPEGRLSQYQRIQMMKQHFWKRWNKEYIGELQQRVKWTQNRGELKVGSLVLIKEDNAPPMYWKIGRILAVHPGSDGIVRVATIKTANSEIKRSFSKLCPLPVEEASFSKAGGMLRRK